MMEAADVVFCMTAMHRAHLLARFPWFEDKTFILKKFALGKKDERESDSGDESSDIPDPIGQGLSEYVKVFNEIKAHLEEIIEHWGTENKFRKDVAKTFRIAAGSDHAGFLLKQELIKYMQDMGHTVTDLGAATNETPSDYPDFAYPVAKGVAKGDYDYGLLVCGSGIGVNITANRVPGARAVLARDTLTAKYSRLHDDANILCLGERFTTPTLAKDMLTEWLKTEFEGGRHKRRVEKIDPKK
jgi:ribose 5-phosphate isomerase B